MEENTQSQFNRAEIIHSVQTPLGFFTLGVIVSEFILVSTIPFISHELNSWVVGGMLALIFMLVTIVAYMAIFKTEQLLGKETMTTNTTSKAEDHLREGDRVAIVKPVNKSILYKHGAVSWEDKMSSYIGSDAIIQEFDDEFNTAKLDVDSKEFDWSKEWLKKK